MRSASGLHDCHLCSAWPSGVRPGCSVNKAKADAKVDTDRKIEALDMLTVNVFGEAEFSGTNNSGLELRVSSTGEVTLYLLGSVEVAGKTPAEAERHIRDLLKKDYIIDPHVLVLVKTYRVSNVTVMGQVLSLIHI